nr:hypothetical protein [Tanacetum cinerariifolium]
VVVDEEIPRDNLTDSMISNKRERFAEIERIRFAFRVMPVESFSCGLGIFFKMTCQKAYVENGRRLEVLEDFFFFDLESLDDSDSLLDFLFRPSLELLLYILHYVTESLYG